MTGLGQESADAEFERLAARYRPIFDEIAVGEAQRERDGVAPHEQLRWLIGAGFAGLRIPRELGGEQARLSTVLRLIAELAVADVNLAHVWRNHFSFVEDRLYDRRDPRSDEWLARLGRGEIVGGGWSEPGAAGTAGTISTRIARDGDDWVLDGVKYYSTGSVYARWSTVLALDPDGTEVVVLVDTGSPGVRIGDDWDGFGQRLTGSGSVAYEGVRVPSDRVFAYATRYSYQRQFYQSTLNALLVGVGRAIERDGAAALRARVRSHRNATVPTPTDDPELLEVLGSVSAAVYAAQTAFERSLVLTDALIERAGAADAGDDAGLGHASVQAVAQTQLVATTAVLDAATRVFDALGASGTSHRLGLDRHWRNARTLASHNPRVYVARLLGDALVNGRDLTA
ncbi:acyl-CoA dehydrogenase family protein [Microbacterium marinilacus]|uniref:Dibenzothiophene monooxygenase n=1 Tax=Microbacterium marinilacus TaxID=415209 RepID=A0ABP7BSI0_9MICO|nr:acyl-CoA dehydrogenase family protein [Microbacterium marinilacus]MBY0689235.1 acyl-CoA dehydrogenase family protein [Microbacterium marinilacus]